MGKFLNDYQRMLSPTGRQITLITDNALWRNNPWKEIKQAGRRYRRNVDGSLEIELFNDRDGFWDPVNELDKDYWTDYINKIEQKANDGEHPTRNIFLHGWDIITRKPVKKHGGLLMRQGGRIIEVPFNK